MIALVINSDFLSTDKREFSEKFVSVFSKKIGLFTLLKFGYLKAAAVTDMLYDMQRTILSKK